MYLLIYLCIHLFIHLCIFRYFVFICMYITPFNRRRLHRYLSDPPLTRTSLTTFPMSWPEVLDGPTKV